MTSAIQFIEKLKLKLHLAKHLKDRAGEAEAYNSLGICADKLGDSKQAIEYHELDLQVSREIKDRSGERRAYCNLGIAYLNLGDCERAIKCHKVQLNIAKEEGDRANEGNAYGNLGKVYQNIGDFTQAVEYQEKSLHISKALEDRAAEGIACCNLGLAYSELDDYKRAIEYHELDLEIAKEGGDRAGEGRACCNLGVQYRKLGDFKQAIRYGDSYLLITKEMGDRTGERRAYLNLGHAYDGLFDFKQGLENHKLCLHISKELGDRAGEGEAYSSLGTVYLNLGNLEQAIECHKLHLQIAKEVGNRTEEACAYCNLAIACDSVGNYQEALEYNKLLLSTTTELGHKPGEARAYCNLGTVYLNLGDYKQAIEYTQRQLDMAKEMGNRDGVGRAYCHLGSAYGLLGDNEQAIKYKKLHLEITKELGDKICEARSCSNVGIAYKIVHDFQNAIKFYNLDLTISKKLGDRQGEGRAYCNLGNAYYELCDLKQAIEYYEWFMSIAKEIGDKPGEARAFANFGNVFRSLGDFKQALECYEMDLRLTKEMKDKDGEGMAHYCCGMCNEELGFLDDALRSYQDSVEAYNSMRDLLQSKDEWKIGLRNEHQRPYQAIWRLLLKQNKIEEALCAAEQGRAQALEDLLIQQYGFGANQCSTEALSLDDVSNYTTSTVVYAALQDDDVINMWIMRKGERVHFWKEMVDFKHLQNKAGPELQPLLANCNDLQSLVDNTIKLICPPLSRCEDRSLDSLYQREGVILEVEAEETSAPVQDRSDRSDEPRATPQHDFDLLLSFLYDVTFKPVTDRIRGDNELIIIPDGPLFLAPFAAFRDSNSQYLSESFRIRVAPSLNSLKLIAGAPQGSHNTRGALIVGDPCTKEIVKETGPRRMEKVFKQLPNAREEAKMIGGILNTSPLIGEKASKEAVLKTLNTVSLVHIAAHGDRESGAIALSPNPARASKIPKKEDYMLTMADVLSVGLRARLIVLSCCHSGRGSIKAEGVVGIARAFLGAGARSVLVSLWALHDEATLEFMRSFYQQIVDGKSASVALNQAMKCMRESQTFSAVEYWAPFVLIGDDVTLDCREMENELQSNE